MGARKHRSKWFVIVACALLAAALLALARPVWAGLPPRPTPQPTTQPVAPPAPTGGFIELRAQFPSTWPWASVHWQDLWSVVQWQDTLGGWHDVEGWQGTLDGVASGEGETVVGTKVWWVAEKDLGTEPFRWVVYRSRGGAPLATSDPFNLPGFSGGVVTSKVSLVP